MNITQIMAEIGRLHMENIALRAERDQLMAAMDVMAGPADVAVSESESGAEPSEAPDGDGSPAADG